MKIQILEAAFHQEILITPEEYCVQFQFKVKKHTSFFTGYKECWWQLPLTTKLHLIPAMF